MNIGIQILVSKLPEQLHTYSVALIFYKCNLYQYRKVMDKMAIGTSLYDENGAKIVPNLIEKAEANNVKIHLPVDFVTADKFAADAQVGSATVEEGIPDDWMGLDAGPKSIELFKEVIGRAKTVIWNG